ncbi:MAG: hypothetical protein IKQ40_07220 [Lachnospiraceae bacterium]|nr:hypothetical protein [Lachnospiraceae bacterium]
MPWFIATDYYHGILACFTKELFYNNMWLNSYGGMTLYRIESFDHTTECPTLDLTPSLFHDALRLDPGSLDRFHVANSVGDDFDIVYYDNNDDIEPLDTYPEYQKPPFMASYRIYDEEDTDSLWMGFFDGVSNMIFEELNEYTIVLTKLVLEHTDIEVYCMDQRILWFIPSDARLHVCDKFPEALDKDSLLYIQKELGSGIEDGRFRTLSSTYAFHNVFLLQWILDGRDLSHFKFITVDIDEWAGIGLILSYCRRYRIAFERFGLRFVHNGNGKLGKFNEDHLLEYFALDLHDEESDDDNTLVVPSFMALTKTKFIKGIPHSIDESIITQKFKAEMDEYYDGLFGSEKVLGVMIRGTDYVTAGMTGDRKMATAVEMAPLIHDWIGKYGFERIFLATEDEDALEYMRSEFGHMLVALSQERLKLSDLRQNELISVYEKEHADGMYEEKLEDTTVNYFYALYMLSKCDSFVCSGRCNGWDVVLSLNNDRFSRCYKFSVGIESPGSL